MNHISLLELLHISIDMAKLRNENRALKADNERLKVENTRLRHRLARKLEPLAADMDYELSADVSMFHKRQI
jgi:regulator of replication initiation timing